MFFHSSLHFRLFAVGNYCIKINKQTHTRRKHFQMRASDGCDVGMPNAACRTLCVCTENYPNSLIHLWLLSIHSLSAQSVIRHLIFAFAECRVHFALVQLRATKNIIENFIYLMRFLATRRKDFNIWNAIHHKNESFFSCTPDSEIGWSERSFWCWLKKTDLRRKNKTSGKIEIEQSFCLFCFFT